MAFNAAPRIEGEGAVWWLLQAVAADEPACPPLAGTERADVCVVGGGFTGLWAAIEVREQAPDARVVLLDREGCGFGASGRNGGWATGWHDELDRLVERFGPEEGLRLAARSSWAIDRIEAFCAEHGIDCRFRRQGALLAAMAPAQLAALEAPLAAGRRHGLDELLEEVSAAEARRRTGSPLPLGALRQTDAAAVHPGLLVRGLRRAALRLGVLIREGSPMIELEREPTPVVRTPAGRVDADRVILATGAYSGAVRELRRAFVPVGSHIVLTEPLPEVGRLDWSRGELFGDMRLMVHYAQVTTEGRIAFGRGGGAIGMAGRVSPRHFHNPRIVASVAADFRRWFPQLAAARVTHAWGGAVDRAPGHLPFAGALADGRIVYGLGYSGNGVAPSALLGRVLGRMALGISDEDTRSPLTHGPPGYLPPEPLRQLGGLIVRRAVERAEVAEEQRRPAGLAGRARPLVYASMPAALEPRLRGRRRR